MKEIRIHGRGGQGSLVLSQFMAIAALEDAKYAIAFPFLGAGGERRGKPIMAFCRLSPDPIRLRCRVHTPDYVVVQDATILAEVDVAEGVRPGGLILINSELPVEQLPLDGSRFSIVSISADAMARRLLGRPIVNSALLGAFAALTGELSLEATRHAVLSRFPGELGEKNARLVEESFMQSMKGAS
jgi:pyruvate ferredoxin oxidoreductase gamma subunit